MEMGVGGKYMTTCLGMFNLLVGKSNIVNYVLKVVNDKILTIIQEMYCN